MKKIHLLWLAIGAALIYVFFIKGKGGFAIFSADKSTIHSVPNVPGAKSSAVTSPTGTFGREV